MRNKLHLSTSVTVGLLLAFGLVSQSCGTAQQVGDDIMRAGGISSTGNKDDEETGQAQAKQEQSMPVPPNSPLVCENPVDLSGQIYTRIEQSVSQPKSCTQEDRSLECVDQMIFSTNENVTIRLRLEGQPPVTLATNYRMCGLDLGLWTVNVEGDPQIESFKSSDDRGVLTHIPTGHAFQLTQ